MCRKHELIQYELEMAVLDLASKKQQREELTTGVTHTHRDRQTDRLNHSV